MVTWRTDPRVHDALAFVVVVLSRLPFIGVDLGRDPDAYRVVLAADRMRSTGEYHASRNGANPVHEIATALLGTHSPIILNGTSVLMMALAAVFLARTWRTMGLPRPALVGAAFTFYPVIFVASTSYKDYAWTIALVLMALSFAVQARPIASGVALAFAIGCRLPAIILGPAFVLVLWVALSDPRGHTRPPWPSRRVWGALVRFGMTTGVLTVVLFLPPILRFGRHMLTSQTFEGRVLAHLHRWGVESGGIIGTLLIIGLVLVALYRTAVGRSGTLSWYAPAWALACVAHLALYAYNPNSAMGSYAPMVLLSLLLLVGPALTSREWAVAAGLMFVAPFALTDGPLSNPNNVRGPVLSDHAQREKGRAFRERTLEVIAALPPSATIAVGSHLPALMLARAPELHGRELVYAFEARHRGGGGPLYYLPSERRLVSSEGVTPEEVGAVALPTPSLRGGM